MKNINLSVLIYNNDKLGFYLENKLWIKGLIKKFTLSKVCFIKILKLI